MFFSFIIRLNNSISEYHSKKATKTLTRRFLDYYIKYNEMLSELSLVYLS